MRKIEKIVESRMVVIEIRSKRKVERKEVKGNKGEALGCGRR